MDFSPWVPHPSPSTAPPVPLQPSRHTWDEEYTLVLATVCHKLFSYSWLFLQVPGLPLPVSPGLPCVPQPALRTLRHLSEAKCKRAREATIASYHKSKRVWENRSNVKRLTCEPGFPLVPIIWTLHLYSTSVWLPSILPLRWESSKTSCVAHLALSVPIPSSGVWDHLVEIWGLSQVRLQFPKSPKVGKSLTKINKNRRNFWTDNAILMPFEI